MTLKITLRELEVMTTTLRESLRIQDGGRIWGYGDITREDVLRSVLKKLDTTTVDVDQPGVKYEFHSDRETAEKAKS